MEKFCLKWNDFQLNASKSFGVLRREKDFFDVTLVSDDEVQVSAHKVVLSACSSFFKSILKNNPHSHPLLYLGGVSSENLSFIMDYIYQGEVQIFQTSLDSFLDAAQKLKIDGLLTSGEEEDVVTDNLTEQNEDTKEQNINDFQIEPKVSNIYSMKTNEIENISIDNGDHEAARQKAKEMIFRTESGFQCNVCTKEGKDLRNMLRHAETHIEGVSYPCQHCGKTFRSVNSLKSHKTTRHKYF